MAQFRGLRSSISLVFALGLMVGCRISPNSKYQDLKQQTAVSIIRDTKSLVVVSDYIHSFLADGFLLNREQWVIYWRPDDTRDRSQLNQEATRYVSEAAAAKAFVERSAHLQGYSWVAPAWSEGLGLKSDRNIVKCDRNPGAEPGSQAILRCEYMAQHGVWVHVTFVELFATPIDLPALIRIIQDSDRSIAYAP